MINALTKEQNLLLNLIAKGVSSKSVDIDLEMLGVVDWKVLVRESRVQSVMYLAFESAKPFKKHIPVDVYPVWENASMLVLSSNLSVFNDQVELIRLLDGKYPYIILKGQSAGHYYPNPEHRAYGDVDFLVDKNSVTAIESILLENGYEKVGLEHDNHVVFKKGTANLEMHFRVAGIPFGELGKKVVTFLNPALETAEINSTEFGNFNAPSPLYHGLILLLHMQHHMLGEGLGLRHLCDYAVYFDKTKNEPFWKETLIPFLKEIGLYTYASIMAKTCSLAFNLDYPNFFEEVSEELCIEILQDVFKGGTFGTKDEDRKKSGMLISEHGNSGTRHGSIYNLADGLHGAVLTQYKIVKKVWILYPFIYSYRAFRFLFLTMIGKKPKLSKMNAQAKERKSVYEKLKVFQP
ncbi:MAG: nucleotidyltransferase family protein [Clostridia bacterium]|nr:nucleotidyltransferase family protein [Clostridia bacterium]